MTRPGRPSSGPFIVGRDVEKSMSELLFEIPAGCYLERNEETIILRQPDGSIVGRFDGERAAPGDAALRVRFLGQFELLCDGEPVCLGRNGRALAILKYLLAHGPRPVSQDHLMGWLWPESNLKHARWSLNSAIYALRRILSGCPASVAPCETILFENGAYRISPDLRISSDADEFDAHYEEGSRLEKKGRTSEADAEYERAIGLYEGDYLIEDLYEDWTAIERERLMGAYIEMLERLAEHRLRDGDFRGSIRACYRALEKDRCDEDGHRLLMECFVRLGRRSRALRQYRLCEQALGRQWGMEPSPETRALYAGILADGSR